MANNIPITTGTGAASVATESIGGISYQQIKVVSGQVSSTTGWRINTDGSAQVSVVGTLFASVSGTIGASIVGLTPVNIIGASSVSGTVGASIIGLAPVTINGQVGTQITSVVGGPISLFAPTASFISGITSVMTGTGQTSVLVAAGTSIKNYITHIICTNGATAGTFVDIKDGGGNVLYSGFAAANGGGFSSYIYPPLVGSANKSVDAQPRAQASIIVAMTGYTA